jgi:hypothetical protein
MIMFVDRPRLLNPRGNSPCPLPLFYKCDALLALDGRFDVVYLSAIFVISYGRDICDERGVKGSRRGGGG